jgi:hypothetical protein
MNHSELSDEQKKLVWRYVEVWRRFRRLPEGYRSFAELDDDLVKGSGMFLCGLLVEAHSSSVISADVKDPKFHMAIFGNDDSSASDMTAQELQQARRYIIQGHGEAPVRWWWAKPPVPTQRVCLVAAAE